MQDLTTSSPVIYTRTFQMRNDCRHVADTPDLKCLIHCREDGVRLGAHVSDVDSSRIGEQPSQGGHLFRRSCICGEETEPVTQPQCSRLERLSQLCTHCRDFDFGGATVQHVHVVIAERCMSHQGAYIDCGLSVIDGCDIRCEGWIAKGIRFSQQVHWIGWFAV